MNRHRAVLHIARWEFLRYLKIKQQIVGMLITFFAGATTVGVMRLSDRGADDVVDVAIINPAGLPVAAGPGAKFRLTAHEATEEEALRSEIAEGERAGVLIIRDRDHAELIVRKRGDWSDELRNAVFAGRQQTLMVEQGLKPEALAKVLTPPEFRVTLQRKDGASVSKLNRVAVAATLGLMLMAVFIGMSYVFASITGEKQIRVTEQIISAIPAQSWIDGKILGLIGVSLVTVINTALSSAALVFIMLKINGKSGMGFHLGSPALIATVVIFALMGLLFWFSFLAVVASVIDDPYDSSRGSYLMVPIFATVLAFLVAKNPDGRFARALSLFPATSPSAMPARMIMTGVSWPEILLSLALLAAGAMILRIAAGRIFRLAMLMYGKEPTWAEMKRWALQRDGG